jgi:ectoine hydroxylase-related dioxygenase (phytanoyl-CoA dioxygenase family)
MQAEPVSGRRGNNDGPERLEQDPAFAPCLEDSRVMAAVAYLLGGDVVLLAFRGREPMAGSGQQGLHVDAAQAVEPDRQMLANAFWILDDMDEANGATRVVPGSHRLRRIPGRDLLQPSARHPEAVTLKARAGDVIVFSAHLWHAGSKNLSGARRRIAMAHFGRHEAARTYATP